MAALDKFYTRRDVATECIKAVGGAFDWAAWDLVIEPSAGNGSFLTQLRSIGDIKRLVGIDIEPDAEDIERQDFFEYAPDRANTTPSGAGAAAPAKAPRPRILVIGNPPFGRVSSLAIRFFNHAAAWATAIAFIVPRTFRRVSVQNKLNMSFHLTHDSVIPERPCAFDPPMAAKCCFQVWERRERPRRVVSLAMTHPDWEFLAHGPKDEKGQPTPPAADGKCAADFAVRAYGGKCGETRAEGLLALRPKSWHWVRVAPGGRCGKAELMARIGALDYSISRDTARQNSIGRAELVLLYSRAHDERV